MPAPEELILLSDQAATPPREDDSVGWASLAAAAKKKKKKTKKNASLSKDTTKSEEQDDSPPFPPTTTAFAPASPGDHGVKLQPPSQDAPVPGFDDDTTACEDGDPLPTAVSKRSPAPSPLLSSPQLAHARPSIPASPPIMNNARFQPPGEWQSTVSAHRPISLGAASLPPRIQPRRESFAAAPAPQPAHFMDPPLPHMPQPHFFGLPDIGLHLNPPPEAGRPAGSNGYCCCLDSFADSGDDASAKKSKDAVLVGCEGGLEVFRVLPNKLEVVGRLEGLRGSVTAAKIIPHTDRVDALQSLRPLIAVIVHGPSAAGGSGTAFGIDTPVHAEETFTTSVEVYSLQSQRHVATLYESVPSAIEASFARQGSSVPSPAGDLTVSAEGRYVIVTSGKSGEVFVFSTALNTVTGEAPFRCIGKYWTALQKSHQPGSRSLSLNDPDSSTNDAYEQFRRPLYSHGPRWLAIVPPTSSSRVSIAGSPALAECNPSPPGLATHVAPPLPLITCEVVGTDIEGTWSRLGRQAAQGLVKYSQKGIEMSLQGWKELTQPSPPSGRQAHDRIPSRDDMFPPTKGPKEDPSRLAKEPALVSIIDLDSLLEWEVHKAKHIPLPVATFALVEGCNFLSFSATGTKLMTSSRKGEITTVWDLTQVAHGVPKQTSRQDSELENGPCIKQTHRFIRNTPSTVLESAWTANDDALAILTAHGTVHLHDIPSLLASRKRKRKSTLSTTPIPEKADATIGLSTAGSPPSSNQGFIGSIKSSWQSVSTQVNSIASTNPATALGLPTTFAGFREATAAAGNIGSRAVARGFSQGYTAAKGGASDYWHADDNKVRLKSIPEGMCPGVLRWIYRQSTSSIVIVCGGTVHVHPVQRVTRRKGDEIITGLKHEKHSRKAFVLPPIATRTEVTASQAATRPDACTRQGPHGFWSFRHAASARTSDPADASARRPSSQQVKSLLSGQANDVETNPPYCPFHVDPRVSVLAFDESDGSRGSSSAHARQSSSPDLEKFETLGHGMADEEHWVFGGPLPASSKMNERMADDSYDENDGDDDEYDENNHDDDDDDDDPDALAGQMESRLTIKSGSGGGGGSAAARGGGEDEIRINTRRRHKQRRNARSGNGSGDGNRADGDFELLEDGDG